MTKKEYRRFKETIFHEKLDNGLNLILMPKANYNSTYANLKINFGSINNLINLDNNIIRIPAGTAHFLEHKMFDKKDYDVTDLFDNNGAYSNAFTSFNSTNYLFSSTKNISENIIILLNMVQNPYFSANKIKKEIGIIKQEIDMYASDPNAKIYFDTISNLFPKTSLSYDIAGTLASIKQIDEKILYAVHENYYVPENMTLTIVGCFNVDRIIDDIKKIKMPGRKFSQNHVIQKTKNEINASKSNLVRQKTVNMGLHQNKVALAYRGNVSQNIFLSNAKYELCLEILFDTLFSENSNYLNDLFNQKIIDDSFEFSFEIEKMYGFIIFISETNNPDQFINSIKKIVEDTHENIGDLSKEIELQKKESIGNRISLMNSLEDLSSELGSVENEFINVFDEIELIDTINMNDIKEAFTNFVDVNNYSINIIQ